MPNFSVGADQGAVAALELAIGDHAEVLDRHWDRAHGRCVLTLAAAPTGLREGLLAAAGDAVERLDLRSHSGQHPRIGVLDVCPVVFVEPDRRQAAVAIARQVAEGVASLGVPVFLYGELASSPERRERHFFRRGGPAALAERMAAGDLVPDLGPPQPHPSAGATLLTARAPLAAFNVELAGGTLEGAREIAARLRESGGGPAGVRAIAIDLGDGRLQISTNIHDPIAVPLGELVAEVERLAPAAGARVEAAELIGLVPSQALRGYPEAVPIRDFNPDRQVIENRLGGLA